MTDFDVIHNNATYYRLTGFDKDGYPFSSTGAGFVYVDLTGKHACAGIMRATRWKLRLE